jgi:glycosyltransferase involved in cell wall biosynthesis
MAAAKRLLLVCKGLVEAGAKCTVFHVGGTAFDNSESCGTVDGVHFQYCPTNPRRSKNRFMRAIKFFLGVVDSIRKINQLTKKERICVYACTGPHLWAIRWLKVPVVIECNEWFPEKNMDLIRSKTFPLAEGFVAISKPISENIISSFNPSRTPFLLPILVEQQTVDARVELSLNKEPYFFWCGSAVGYGLKDVEFILDAFQQVGMEFPKCRLEFAGHFPESTRELVSSTCAKMGIPIERVVIHGFVTSEMLSMLTCGAAALLLPLWEEVRSSNRFPTKLGEYLLTGRPVITAQIGDVAEYCNVNNTLIYQPNDAEGFASCMKFVLNESGLADQIGERGAEMARSHFDYLSYGEPLLDFLHETVRRAYR